MKKYYFVRSFLFFLLVQSCQVPSTNKVQNSNSLEASRALADSHSETLSVNPFQKEDHTKALELYRGVIETWQEGLHPAQISFEGQEQNSRRTKRSLLLGTIAWYLKWKATAAESWEIQPTRQQEKQGKALKAWYYPYSSWLSSGAKKTAIVSHWLSGDSGEMGAHLGVFSELGFNVLVPDFRGHGRSKDEGDFNHRTVGICDGQDLVDWVREIQKRDPSQEIVVFGVSLGAISALKMASLLDANDKVKAIVADSVFAELKEFLEDPEAVNHLVNTIDPPFISSKEEMLRVEKEFEGILFDNLGLKVSEGLTKQDLENAQSGLPLLIIQGTEDRIMPMYMAENAQKYYEKSGNKVEIWKVEGADHGYSIRSDFWNDRFDEYQQKIKEFLEKNTSL